METAREILQFLHYHPLSSREGIRVGREKKSPPVGGDWLYS